MSAFQPGDQTEVNLEVYLLDNLLTRNIELWSEQIPGKCHQQEPSYSLSCIIISKFGFQRLTV